MIIDHRFDTSRDYYFEYTRTALVRNIVTKNNDKSAKIIYKAIRLHYHGQAIRIIVFKSVTFSKSITQAKRNSLMYRGENFSPKIFYKVAIVEENILSFPFSESFPSFIASYPKFLFEEFLIRKESM